MHSLIDACEANLFGRFERNNGFLLLDMTAEHPLEAHLKACPDDRKYWLEHPDFAAQPNKAPLLVLLTGRHDPLLPQSADLAVAQTCSTTCTVRQVCAWLFSDKTLADLGSWLSTRLSINHGGGLSRWRIHDPRVVAQLPCILKPEQLSLLLNGISEWCFLDESAHVQCLERPTIAEFPARTSFLVYPTQTQMDALHRMETVNSTIRLLRHMGHLYEKTWIQTLHDGVERSQRFGCAEQEHQMVFAAHCVHVHRHFERHPSVREALSRVLGQGGHFYDAKNEFSESALDVVAQQLSDPQWIVEQGVVAS